MTESNLEEIISELLKNRREGTYPGEISPLYATVSEALRELDKALDDPKGNPIEYLVDGDSLKDFGGKPSKRAKIARMYFDRLKEAPNPDVLFDYLVGKIVQRGDDKVLLFRALLEKNKDIHQAVVEAKPEYSARHILHTLNYLDKVNDTFERENMLISFMQTNEFQESFSKNPKKLTFVQNHEFDSFGHDLEGLSTFICGMPEASDKESPYTHRFSPEQQERIAIKTGYFFSLESDGKSFCPDLVQVVDGDIHVLGERRHLVSIKGFVQSTNEKPENYFDYDIKQKIDWFRHKIMAALEPICLNMINDTGDEPSSFFSLSGLGRLFGGKSVKNVVTSEARQARYTSLSAGIQLIDKAGSAHKVPVRQKRAHLNT